MRASRILAMRPSPFMAMRPSPFMSMRATRPAFRTANKEEHSAHTISQRLRTLKKIPVELIPIGVVLGVAVGAAFYSLIRKLYVDKQLRLTRSGGLSTKNTADNAR